MKKPTTGQTIAALRDALGISQPELARRVGISQPSLSNIENDKTRKLRGDTLAGLCRELGVGPDVILKPSGVAAEPTDEAELALIYRSLTKDDQGHLIATARAFRERMHAARKGPVLAVSNTTQQPARLRFERHLAAPKKRAKGEE